MCTALVACALWLGTSAPARAQLDLSLLDYPGTPGATHGILLACDQPDSSYRIYATFTPGVDVPEFRALEAVIQLGYVTAPHTDPRPLSPFWHFEQGGCNAGAISAGTYTPPGAVVLNPWGFAGSQATTTLSYQQSPTSGGVLRVKITRLGSSSLVAGQTYFGFTLDLFTCSAGTCDGCDELVGVFWTDAILNESPGPWLCGGCGGEWSVCLNHEGQCPVIGARGPGVETTATAEAYLPVPRLDGPCGPTPTLDHSWGALKIRYR